MRTYALVALGCAFWLFPLAAAIREIASGFHEADYGLSYENLWLLITPSLMIVLTLVLGWAAKRGKVRRRDIIISTLASVLACFCLLGILGRGV
jgi:cytochrome bd-type quinol oxidase subunit 2